MARAYTVATAALTLATTEKWLDNILSHHDVAGIQKQRQGVSRRLSVEAMLGLSVVLLLIQDVGLPTPHTIALADMLIRGGGRYESSHGLTIVLDLSAVQQRLLERLESAVEAAPVPRRGRPPANKTGRLD
jgi:hypothetical protein